MTEGKNNNFDWLPALLPCDWNAYQETIESAYRVFLRDFGTETVRPQFRGKRMGLKRHPELDGKSATFWHFVTEGNIEADRTPVRARIERIAWPRALLVEAVQKSSRVLVWANMRPHQKHRGSTRWLIALPDFSYVVVIDERDDYVLPWTAYTVEYEHRRRKMKREYDAWRKAEAEKS